MTTMTRFAVNDDVVVVVLFVDDVAEYLDDAIVVLLYVDDVAE